MKNDLHSPLENKGLGWQAPFFLLSKLEFVWFNYISLLLSQKKKVEKEEVR